MARVSITSAYRPKHEENRMGGEGDAAAARANFLARRPPNLTNLLRLRYSWMRAWIEPEQTAVELGSGHGLIKEFITDRQIILTDVSKASYIDQWVDALNLPFAANSVDAFICSHMIHHVAQPLAFLRSLQRVLKPGGVVIVQEIQTSLLMRLVLRAMRHEGWSYHVNVFDEEELCNDPADPWSANCAIPDMLFADPVKFSRALPGFKVEVNEFNECLGFFASGGVIATTPTVQLPRFMLALINVIDRLLVGLSPRLFALGRSVVLRKVDVQQA